MDILLTVMFEETAFHAAGNVDNPAAAINTEREAYALLLVALNWLFWDSVTNVSTVLQWRRWLE